MATAEQYSNFGRQMGAGLIGNYLEDEREKKKTQSAQDFAKYMAEYQNANNLLNLDAQFQHSNSQLAKQLAAQQSQADSQNQWGFLSDLMRLGGESNRAGAANSQARSKDLLEAGISENDPNADAKLLEFNRRKQKIALQTDKANLKTKQLEAMASEIAMPMKELMARLGFSNLGGGNGVFINPDTSEVQMLVNNGMLQGPDGKSYYGSGLSAPIALPNYGRKKEDQTTEGNGKSMSNKSKGKKKFSDNIKLDKIVSDALGLDLNIGGDLQNAAGVDFGGESAKKLFGLF